MVVAVDRETSSQGGDIIRLTQTSAANAAQTLTDVDVLGDARELSAVLVRYSAAPTHAGVTVLYDSGAATANDTLLETSPANAEHYVYQPGQPLPLSPGSNGDRISVTAPAGGAGITSSITVLERGG